MRLQAESSTCLRVEAGAELEAELVEQALAARASHELDVALLEVAVDARVVHGRGRLVGEAASQFHLLLGEATFALGLADHEQTERRGAETQGQRQTRLLPPPLHRLATLCVQQRVGHRLEHRLRAEQDLALFGPLVQQDEVAVHAVVAAEPEPGTLHQHVLLLHVLPDHAVVRAEGVHHLARHGVEHVLQHQAGGHAASGVQQRVHAPGLRVPLPVGLHAVDGQRGEVAHVARQGQAGRRQAAGSWAEQDETAVRPGTEAERDAETRAVAQRLAAAQHLALRGTVVQQPDFTVVRVRGAGRAHERVERVVVLHDQTALHGEGVQERAGDQLERGVGICLARDRAAHLQECVAPRAREPQGAPHVFAMRTAAVPVVTVPARARPTGAPSRWFLPPSLPARKRSRSPGRNRRWPLGVRRQGTTPASAQRRRVCSLTSSISAAAATRSQRRRPPDRRPSLSDSIRPIVGRLASFLHQLFHFGRRACVRGSRARATPPVPRAAAARCD